MAKKLDHTTALEHLLRVDRKLARIIAKAGPCGLQPERTQSIFEALLESIIYQQLNGNVAATITERVKALFPEDTHSLRTRRGLVAGFPSPEQILAATPELLRSAGLSQAKMLAIRPSPCWYRPRSCASAASSWPSTRTCRCPRCCWWPFRCWASS